MNKILFSVMVVALMMLTPLSSSFGGITNIITTDSGTNQLISYYDLRNRESYVQVSNVSTSDAAIHVQIFRNDFPDCNEINFYDTLTPNDTHIYDMRNLAGNGLPVNIQLADDSNGFVVITLVGAPVSGSLSIDGDSLLGNFRILDNDGYEYRTNSAGVFQSFSSTSRAITRYTFNFNQIGGNNQADVVALDFNDVGSGEASVTLGSADVSTLAFVYNNAEIPTSCDEFEFVCGSENSGFETDFLNVGINNIFPSSNGENLICQGNLDTSGFVELLLDEDIDSDEVIVGFVGLNNGNSTGSMDSWVANNTDICEFLGDDFDTDCEEIEEE